MGRGRRGSSFVPPSAAEMETAIFVGNGATAVGFTLVAAYAQQHLLAARQSWRGGGSLDGGLTFKQVLLTAPLTLLLLLLRDDGGFLAGLSVANRYAPPLLALQVRSFAHRLFL